MPLIKDGRAATDPWTDVGLEEPLPGSGPVIVPLARWREDRDALLARGGALGVRLASSELIDEVADDLGHLDLVALEFPHFKDGRHYSTARLLRERHGFPGEVRAVGNVLRDQFLFMHRCGFDAYEVADDATVEAWSDAIREYSVWYQPTADGRPWIPATRHQRRAAE